MKASVTFFARLITLTVLYFICYAAVAAALLPAPEHKAPDAENAAMLVALLAVSLLNAVVLAYMILRSRWAGWKLTLTTFFVLFGVLTVMPQIETAVFVTTLPAGMLPRLFLAGAVFAVVFAPLAVLVLGKRRPGAPNDADSSRLKLPAVEWFWRLLLIMTVYVAIYFTFGYFIAWQNPAVRAYYGGSDPGGFLAQMRNVLRDSPWLVLLQAGRALLWTALAVPVIRMMKGRRWEAGLAVALLFGVLMTSQLLLPNPLMPREVRMTHLWETASSNFLFGWALVWLLHVRRSTSSFV